MMLLVVVEWWQATSANRNSGVVINTIAVCVKYSRSGRVKEEG